MRNVLFAGACALAVIYASPAVAGGVKHPGGQEGAGVMDGHSHQRGEWMVGYHYKHLSTSGYRNGSSSVSNASVMAAYGEAATEMDMGMHMIEFMAGLTDNLTLMVMPQYMRMDMTHQSSHGGGHIHDHTVDGFGDTEVRGIYSLARWEKGGTSHGVNLDMGASLPTGSIDKTFVNHHHHTYRLPYHMQFGSGTLDPMIGAAYRGSSAAWSWGARTLNYIRLGKNDNGYRLGNMYTAAAWVTRDLADFASLTFRLDGEAWGNVSGRDASLPVTAIAGANPDELAGERVMATIGLGLFADEARGALSGHSLSAEFGVPLYERYSGPQPDTEYRLALAWQAAF